MIKCLICNKQFKSRLGSHIVTHKITIKEYYDKYIRQSNEGICPICGKETSFLGLTKGYSEHCSLKCKGADPKVKEKVENTCLEKYGAPNVYASEYGKQKIKETNIEKYGVEHPQQNKEISEKTTITCKKQYNGRGYASKQILNKIKQTNQEKYGLENPSVFGTDIYKQSIIDKYNVDNPLKSNEIKEKIKQTNLEVYGCENPAQNEEVRQKMYKTLWENGGLHRLEKRCYDKLLEKYSDAVREYKSDKYPFKCDFYIPSEDLYIELNIYWSHGGHYFNENDPQDIELLKYWKSKNNETYEYAIHVWTETDLKKKRCAEDNKLNYLIFWTEEDFIEWLK